MEQKWQKEEGHQLRLLFLSLPPVHHGVNHFATAGHHDGLLHHAWAQKQWSQVAMDSNL
jgi:hypothetical protein